MRAVPITLIMLAMLSAAPVALCADDLLKANGFEVVPTGYDTMTDVYDAARERNRPIMVTTDSVLHTSHLLFDYLLRVVEVEYLQRDLLGLTQTMTEYIKPRTHALPHKTCEQCVAADVAAYQAVRFFSVARRLLEPEWQAANRFLGETVHGELGLIEAHAGFAKSPLFGYDEDYSQYVPRGHYTRNEELERYFKAMMWYGRTSFPLSGRGLTQDQIRHYTAQALVIVAALRDAKVGDESALDVWRRIYETTALFVGQSDDLSVDDYLQFAPKETPVSFSYDELDEIIAKARKLRKPGIIGTLVPDEPAPAEAPMGFRLMGQRFIPDSYIFQQLVYDKVGTRDNPRLFPKGLDVMWVLGAVRARALPETMSPAVRASEILERTGDFDYLHYHEQLEKLVRQVGPLLQEEPKRSLYWRWLACFSGPLVRPLPHGPEPRGSDRMPALAETGRYGSKMLMTVLGSWADLRHEPSSMPSRATRSGSPLSVPSQ